MWNIWHQQAVWTSVIPNKQSSLCVFKQACTLWSRLTSAPPWQSRPQKKEYNSKIKRKINWSFLKMVLHKLGTVQKFLGMYCKRWSYIISDFPCKRCKGAFCYMQSLTTPHHNQPDSMSNMSVWLNTEHIFISFVTDEHYFSVFQ